MNNSNTTQSSAGPSEAVRTEVRRSFMHRFRPPLLFFVSVGVMVALKFFLPGMPMSMSLPATIGGYMLIVLGVGLSYWGSIYFARLRTNIDTFREPGMLVTDGPFRFSRNPMYLGMVIALTGVAIALGAVSPFLVLLTFIIIADRWYIAFEERWMQEKFGDAYTQYRKRTWRWVSFW